MINPKEEDIYFQKQAVKSAVEFYRRYRRLDGILKLQKEQPNIFEKAKKWVNSKPKNEDYEDWLLHQTFPDLYSLKKGN